MREWKQFAEDLSEYPFASEALERGEGDGEETHEDVGGGEIQDEEVGDGVHVPGPDHSGGHQEVAQGPNARTWMKKQNKIHVN